MSNPADAYAPIVAAVLGAAGRAPIEAAFANVIQGAVAPAPAGGEFPFPQGAQILAELTDTPATWPAVIAHHIADFVLPRRQAIPATPVAGAPGAAKVAWNTEARIDTILRKQGDVAFVVPVTNGLPRAVLSQFDFKLHQLQPNPGHDIFLGWQLLKAYLAASPQQVPASAHSSKAIAAQSIRQLAAFEGFCIRLAIAVEAADRAAVSLAETLALWRTEGDLLTPYANARRVAIPPAPACDVIDGISLGDDTDEVFFSMKRGLWSYTYARLITGGLPANAARRTQVENAFKLLAFVHWSLVTAGVDFFWARIAVNPLDRSATVGAIADFLLAHHAARGLPGDKAALQADCDRVLNDLECVLPAAPNQRVIVAPRNPALLVSVMLGEALIFAALDAAAGKGPAIAPTTALKYLAYHCQDHRDAADPMQDKFSLMLISAAVAAARGPAGALKTSLAPFVANLPTSSELKSPDFNAAAVTGDTSGHLKAYQTLDAGGWWTPANLDLLAAFMLTANAPWQGWVDLRGNMGRYSKLRAYYEALLS